MSILAALQTDAKPRQRQIPPDTQQTCIDLPGEAVRCYVYKPKLEIMLRKHRDVIFDIRLFKGMTYTIEADTSDFYNARDKKIVLRQKKQKVSFNDGERLHLWVGRNFKGKLILKANGKLLARYDPAHMDRCRYDDDPQTKPAPMIVVMHNDPTTAAQAQQMAQPQMKPQSPSTPIDVASTPTWTPPYEPLAFSAQREAEPTQTLHVVEVNEAFGAMPKEVADYFKKGGEDTAVDANKLMTRNWLWAQIAGGAAYVGDNKPWIKELWNQKFYLKKIKGKVNIIFKGNQQLRAFLKGTRYLHDSPKVIAISAGAGTLSGVHKATWEATKGTMKGAARYALVLTITLDVAEWLADFESVDPATGKPKRDFYDLAAKIFTDVTWAVVGAALATLGMAGLVAAGLIGTGMLVVIGAIGFAIAAGYGLALIDSELGITPKIAAAARDAAAYLDQKLPRDYSYYESSINNMMLGGAP